MNKAALLITLVILVSFVAAQAPPSQDFDANKAYAWLVSSGSNGNYENSVVTTAFATLALRSLASADAQVYAQQGLTWIKTQEDTEKHCWPKGGCTVKDTAFAIKVLDEFGEDTGAAEEWLRKSLTPALKDNWLLEIITSANGTCKIAYFKDNSKEVSLPVEGHGSYSKFPTCSYQTFLDINSCLGESNLVNNNPLLELTVNCNDLGPGTILALIYRSANTFNIIKNAASAKDRLVIDNACFTKSGSGSCDFDSSLFATWILSEMNSDVKSLLYLKERADSFRTLDNTMLYLSVTDQESKDFYLNNLKQKQRIDGSFDKNIEDTAFALLALDAASASEESTKAVDWLKSKQDIEGSWENNRYKTALVLYAAFQGTAVTLIPPSVVPGIPPASCDNNGICDGLETSSTCPNDCTSNDVCFVDNRCSSEFGETYLNCEDDCSCGDGVCDDAEQIDGSCEIDCAFEEPDTQLPTAVCGNNIQESGEECDGSDDLACPGTCQTDCSCEQEKSNTWLWIVFFLLLTIVIIGYFTYRKTHPVEEQKPFPPLKTKSSSPTQTFIPPPTTFQSQSKSKVENELDRSLREAEKILGKYK